MKIEKITKNRKHNLTPSPKSTTVRKLYTILTALFICNEQWCILCVCFIRSRQPTAQVPRPIKVINCPCSAPLLHNLSAALWRRRSALALTMTERPEVEQLIFLSDSPQYYPVNQSTGHDEITNYCELSYTRLMCESAVFSSFRLTIN